MKTSKGQIVTHNGKRWMVDKVLITGRPKRGTRDYIRAFPMCGEQVLTRSVRIIGGEWE